MPRANYCGLSSHRFLGTFEMLNAYRHRQWNSFVVTVLLWPQWFSFLVSYLCCPTSDWLLSKAHALFPGSELSVTPWWGLDVKRLASSCWFCQCYLSELLLSIRFAGLCFWFLDKRQIFVLCRIYRRFFSHSKSHVILITVLGEGLSIMQPLQMQQLKPSEVFFRVLE